jgi:hypothetical protein
MSLNSPHDSLPIAGDLSYAPLDLYYSSNSLPQMEKRFITDIYLLGSLIFFHFSNVSATQAIRLNLKINLSYGTPTENFYSDLPFLEEAFNDANIQLEKAVQPLAEDLTPEIMRLVKLLCRPDPAKRGDPKLAGTVTPKHNLERIISSFDVLAMRAELKFK